MSIGLVEADRALLGVLCAPALQELFAAHEGQGATLNGQPIRAANTTKLSRAIVEAGWSPRVQRDAYLDLYRRLLDAGAMVRSGGSGALGLADVAAGRLDGYAERHINVWDCAAALAILAGAGAVVSPFLRDHASSGGPILAAAPGVSAALGALLDTGSPDQHVPPPQDAHASSGTAGL